MQKDKVHPLENIHNINKKFNDFFSVPLYYAGMLVTVILFFSPYFFRLFLAYIINIFFNRPVVYLSFFGKYI
jgi:hypothetical protein